LAIADGLGGMGAGAVASELAISKIAELVEYFPRKPNDLLEIFLTVHNEIVKKQADNEQQRFMATTLTFLLIQGDRLIGGHTGDTRASVSRGNGIKRLTEDHTEAQRLFALGKISKEELLNYPRKNILDSALGGGETPRVDLLSFDVMPRDRIFLTSDGFHTKIPLRPMLEISNRHTDVNKFIESAMMSVVDSAPDDNFSIVAAFVDDEG